MRTLRQVLTNKCVKRIVRFFLQNFINPDGNDTPLKIAYISTAMQVDLDDFTLLDLREAELRKAFASV